MKPDQLNRLIRGNGRMQPWFLRNTSELYESAVRSYYERGSSGMPHSTHDRHTRLLPLKDNEGPVRKLKTADPEPSCADEYPRTHRLQAKQAASIASNQLLPTSMQTSRQRSMSFSVGGPEMAKTKSSMARQYSVFGESDLGDSSSISCSSGSEPSQHRLVPDALPSCLRRSRALARRERKRTGRRSLRITELGNAPKLDMDMGMFGARSLSVPPPSGLATGIGNTLTSLMVGQMAPCRRHHMYAIEKTTLANSALKPMGEGDSLMAVDETLKRQISVVDHAYKGRGKSSELGHHLMAGGKGNVRPSGNLLDVIRQPQIPRFRFHTLGERAKQFEYIQFADGPVSNYAFVRRPHNGGYPRRLHKGSSTSSSSSRTTIWDGENQQMQMQMQMRQQSLQLSPRNVLQMNHMQRSRSLEGTRATQLNFPLSPPETEDEEEYGHLETTRNTRGSSLDNSSLASLTARTHTAEQSSATSVVQGPIHNSNEITAIKWSDNRKETPRSKPLRADSSGHRLTWQSAEAGPLERISVTHSRPTDTELRSSTVTPKLTSNSGAHSDSKRTSRNTTDWQGSSTTKSKSQRSSVEASFRGAPSVPSDAASVPFAQEFRPFPAHNVAARVTCPSVRRSQQRSLEVNTPDDDDDDENPLPLCLSQIQSKIKPKVLTTLEGPRAWVPMATKNTTNRVSRTSHRSFFMEDPPIKNQNQQQENSVESEEGEPPHLDEQKWMPGARAIAGPSCQPVKASAQLKGTNQLLAASASQVSAYKRAFRTQQQMLKVEALHRQAQYLHKASPRPNPKSRSSEPCPQCNQVLRAEDVQPIQLPRLHGRQGPTLTVSRTSVRAALKGSVGGKPLIVGSAKRIKGTTESLVKALAAAPVTASLTAGGLPTTAATERPTIVQKARTPTTTTATCVKGAVSGAVTAAKAATRTKLEGGGDPRSSWGGAARIKQTSALTPAVQQQHSRNGGGNGSGNGSGNRSGKDSLLLGFRRETASRVASSLLPRRDDSEQAAATPSPSQCPQHRQHQWQQQKRQQRQQQQQLQQPPRRQLHFQYPPWRPSY